VVQAALAEGIELRSLTYYTSRVATPECAVAPGLVLGFSAITPADIAHGLGVLAKVLRSAR
jgi:GntR family transcriptional regulator/MocR family aminotransferase